MNKEVIILSIETSLRQGGLALLKGSNEMGHWVGNQSVSRSEDLILGINELLTENNLKLHDLDYLAVSTGPGSFTGLRVGIAAGKGLAFAINKLLLGSTILETLAFTAFQNIKQNQDNNEIISIVGAGGEFYYVQKFFWNNEEMILKEATTIKIYSSGELANLEKGIRIVTHTSLLEKLDVLLNKNLEVELISFKDNELATYLGIFTVYKLNKRLEFSEVVPTYVRNV